MAPKILLPLFFIWFEPDLVESLERAGVQETRRALEVAQNTAVDAVFKCALHARGLDALAPDSGADDESGGESDTAKARSVLERHLTRTSGTFATDAVLRFLQLSAADASGDANTAAATDTVIVTTMTSAERSALAAALPRDLSPSAVALVKV